MSFTAVMDELRGAKQQSIDSNHYIILEDSHGNVIRIRASSLTCHAVVNELARYIDIEQDVANERRMLKAHSAGAFDPKQHSHVLYTKDMDYDS